MDKMIINNIGKPIPILYGDVSKSKGYLVKEHPIGQIVTFGEDEIKYSQLNLGDVYIYLNDKFVKLYSISESHSTSLPLVIDSRQ